MSGRTARTCWTNCSAGSTDYEALRPDLWKQSHPEAVRTYRVQERRDRADRQRFHRAAADRGPAREPLSVILPRPSSAAAPLVTADRRARGAAGLDRRASTRTTIRWEFHRASPVRSCGVRARRRLGGATILSQATCEVHPPGFGHPQNLHARRRCLEPPSRPAASGNIAAAQILNRFAPRRPRLEPRLAWAERVAPHSTSSTAAGGSFATRDARRPAGECARKPRRRRCGC